VNGRPPLALAYHGIGSVPVRRDPHGLYVAPERLERHVRWLHDQGYRLVTFDELVARGEDGYCALTFDDGFANNEALIGMGVPATVFVVTDWLGGEHPDAPGARLLDADGVRRLRDAGLEIGGHTASHPDLTELGFEAARDELERGRTALEAILDAPVRTAAYPYGRATAETVRACAAAGFRAACRTSAQGSIADPLDFPRQDMDGPASLLGLRLKAADRYEPLVGNRAVGALQRVGRLLRRT
jgi:peptidoglycan/xylan/chitin deacetylase (PgdA/CDA1 family)